MTRTIEYTDISVPLRNVVEPTLNKWEWILPDWCRRLEVRQSEGVGFVAQFQADVPRRSAELLVDPILLNRTDIEDVIVHELCHAYTTPIGIPAKEYLKAHKVEGPDFEMMWNRVDDYIEGATEDLKDLLMRKVKPC